jgi:ATP adenylyltransferase
MNYLYAPWRGKYINKKSGEKKITPDEQSNHDINPEKSCVFCIKLSENQDAQNFILRRFKYNAIILNLYPYNAGHLMIIPLEHKKRLLELNQEARQEFIDLTAQSIAILEQELKAEGINAGLNLGKAAGAGIPSHLHMHVIPRWPGDTNFMPIIAQTKPISLDLNLVYQDLKPLFEKIKI